MKRYFLEKSKNLNIAPPPARRYNNLIRGVLPLVFLLWFACSKDQMANLQDDNPAVYVKSTVLEQAKQGLRDPNTMKFFDFGYAVGANPNVKPMPGDRNDETELLNGVAYELLRLNQAYNIVPAMISRVGFPYWSRSEIFNDGNGSGPVVLLPFAHLDSDSVEAVLLATPLSDSTGWYTTLYTRKQIDSLASASVLDSNGLGFKVASFVFLDYKLFGTTAQPLVAWLTDVLAGSNVSPAAQDRCGIISWCIDVLGVVFPLTDKPVLDRTIFCWTFNTPCAGSSAGSGAGNCALNENFVWVCDYMLGNLEANGVGGGGGSSNTNPGGATNGDMGTNIMNLYNNGLISEEVMNQLLTLHFAVGLSSNDIDLLLAKPQMMNVLADFLLTNSGSANPLDPVSIKSVFDFALQYNLTSGQFQTLLRNRVLFGQVKNLSEQLEGNNDTANEYIGFCIDLMSIHSEYKWERLEELYNLVNADPNALIKNCEENGEGVEFWSDIASFVPPNSVIQRIENLPGNWNIQEIKNASGTRVNLDLFPVKIVTMPTVNGVIISKDDLISLIRLSLNSFTEGSSFTPFSPQDAQIWRSGNPLGAAIHISINPDDGSVVTSSYSSCCWVFTTLQAPFWDDGIHPVSGNRQFGYKQFPDGSIDIYTRAADRLTKWWHNLSETMAFDGADNLWEGFQEKISTFVIDNGGSAEVRSPIKYRPDWDKVKDALTKEYPLTSISCL